MKLNLDCLHYRGEKPCKYNRLCEGCDKYEAFGRKILVIKLGAMGDVLRTTPILPKLKAKNGACHLTWLVSEEAALLLENNPYIDRVLVLNMETSLRLMVETFDEVICLDKAPSATALASMIRAEKKVGYGMDTTGNIYPFDEASEYSFSLGLSDELKFKKNTKTYQEMTFEMLGLEWDMDNYVFNLPEKYTEFAKNFLVEHSVDLDKPIVGLNTGCGRAFPLKKWTESGFTELADMLVDKLGAEVILLGGPHEVDRNRSIASSAKLWILNTGNDFSLLEFAGILKMCDVVVTSDTIGMHVAVAVGENVVALFGSTSTVEVELYGRGEKIRAGFDCEPCYRKVCTRTPTCMESISSSQIFDKIEGFLKQNNKTSGA